MDQLPALGFAVWLDSAYLIAVWIGFLVRFAHSDCSMLFILILIHLTSGLFDLPNLLSGGALSSPLLVIVTFVLLNYLPAIYTLRYLCKEINEEKRASNR